MARKAPTKTKTATKKATTPKDDGIVIPENRDQKRVALGNEVLDAFEALFTAKTAKAQAAAMTRFPSLAASVMAAVQAGIITRPLRP